MADQLRTINHADMIDALRNVPPMDLKGVALLRESRATGRIPDDRQRVIEATEEMVAYTKACQTTANMLASLEPIPAAEIALVDGYSL